MKESTKDTLKQFALIIGIPLLLIILFCTYDDGTEYSSADVDFFKEQAREEGYREGYEEGYDYGYERGYDNGYSEGYHEGYSE
jgi:hypothetical protein